MSAKNAAISKYLSKWADPSINLEFLNNLAQSKSWDQCAAIPAKAEHQHLPNTIKAIEAASSYSKIKTLIIIVLNIENNSSKEDKQSHQNCLNFFKSKNLFELHSRSKFCDYLVCNFSGENAFTSKQGVGRARKIAGDIACVLYLQEKIKKHYYYSTDADTILPVDIFKLLLPKEFSVLCLNYKHIYSEDPFEKEAMQLYEKYLEYYRNGLAQAGSNYSYYTLGSNLIINMDDYAKVRGFPVREAAEDFYFLNKMAKLKPVKDLKLETPITISGRSSHRVPFGTGQSVSTIAEQLRSKISYKTYDPKCFNDLSIALNSLDNLSKNRDIQAFLKKQQHQSEFWNLHQLKLTKILGQNSKQASLKKQINDYFDAFMTLKFIHFLSDRFYPKVDAKTVLS